MNFSDLDVKKILDVKNYPKDTLVWIALIVTWCVGAVFVYLPLEGKHLRLTRALVSKKQEIEMVKATGINLLTPIELARLQKDAVDFKSGFTKISEISKILNSISEEAKKNRLKVLSLNSETPEKEEGFERLPITMRLEGNYRSFGNFLASLQRMSAKRFVVESFDLKKNSSQTGALDGHLTLSFFSA
jgi:Tfp pilus assembly protein PilO